MAQAGFFRCSSRISRIGSRLRALFVLRERRNVRRRRWRRRSQDVFENPFAAQNGRRPVRIGRHRQNAALAEQSAPGRVLYRDAPEVAAVDVRDAVVLREPVIDEGVVRRQQIDHVVVLAHDAVEEHFGLFAE